MNEAPRYSSLRDYLRVVRDQWLVIALTTILAGAVALAISLRQEPVYEATAAIAFEDESQQLSVLGAPVSPNVPVGQTPQARAQTIDEPEVIQRLARALPDRISADLLGGAISTALDEESFLVDVTATWGEADFAATLANEFADQAARYTNARTRREYSAAVDDLERRLDRLGEGVTAQTERAQLVDQLTNVRFLAEQATPARVAETAQPPSAPVSPRTLRNTALGLLLGLVVGLVVAFLRDSLDRRLRTSREVTDELAYPVLGHVRDEFMGKSLRSANGYLPDLAQQLEGFRIIRQNLDFLAPGPGATKRTIVTSALPEEGKSTVALALALASAAAGRQTLLVECDLRRPSLAGRLGLNPAPGLTDYLVGDVEPREVLQVCPAPTSSPVAAAGNGGGAAVADRPLVCITAGTRSPRPAEMIGSERFAQFLDAVSEAYDRVILDSSPLLPVADTLELVPRADAVLLCVRANQTTRDEARAARAALEHFPDRPTGAIITGVRRRDAPAYSYYAYGYGEAPLERQTAAG